MSETGNIQKLLSDLQTDNKIDAFISKYQEVLDQQAANGKLEQELLQKITKAIDLLNR